MTSSAALTTALTWLHTQQAEMERTLGLLVEENSHTAETARVNKVGHMLRELFTMPGLHGEIRTSAVMGNHLTWETAAKGPATLLVGHHDTVFPPGTFEGMKEDGALLRGPGTLDMKGGLVVVRTALQALAHAGVLESIPVRLISVGDEEVGSEDSAPHIKALCQEAKAALVFEAGRAGDAIITQRKGTGGLNVKATGKAAHAGNAHQDGVNAIWALSRFVDGAQGLTDYARGLTVNVGKFTGGIGKNTVPDAAEAQVDFRFLTTDAGRELEEAFARVAQHAAASVKGSAIQVHGGIKRQPLQRSEHSVKLLEAYAACAKEAGLGASEAPILGGGSDANTTSAAGVPSIDGLGPRGKGFHTHDEFIERNTLIPKADALVRFLMKTAV